MQLNSLNFFTSRLSSSISPSPSSGTGIVRHAQHVQPSLNEHEGDDVFDFDAASVEGMVVDASAPAGTEPLGPAAAVAILAEGT